MKQFRYILAIIIVVVLGFVLIWMDSVFSMKFLSVEQIIELVAWVVLLLAVISTVTALIKFNSKSFSSYFATFLSLFLICLSGWLVVTIWESNVYKIRITKEFDLRNFEVIETSDKINVEILSYTIGLDCTPKTTYYYSVVCVNKEDNDTIRVLSSCQMFSKNEINATVVPHTHEVNNILDSLGLDFNTRDEKYILIDEQIPYQSGDYKVIIGNISYGGRVDVFQEHLEAN